MKRFGAFCSSMPADCSRKTNGAALPSMIGTSAAVRSMNALSIPKPAKADIRCSTVPTRAPSCSIVVPSVVSVTRRAIGRNVDGLRQIEPAKHDAGIGRRRTQGHVDLVAASAGRCRWRVSILLECVDARCPSLHNVPCFPGPDRPRSRRQMPTTLRIRRGRGNYHSAVTGSKETGRDRFSPPAVAGTPECRATLRACRCPP